MFYIIKKHSRYVLVLLFLVTTEAYSVLSVKNLPPRNDYFTGRVAYLDDMQNKLSQQHIVYLVGYGGVGKSQLAKEYSYINEKKYDLIWWFDLNNDLISQYESLLISIRNNKRFKNLLNINADSIAPTVLIDFTNSLLSMCDCKWLLIFDNALDDQEIKLPKPKKDTPQHIIVTTRKKQRLGDNVFTLGSFTMQEAEIFLSKVHKKEKKEKITMLCKVLHNYPLALAQVSEEILMYKDGIGSYFKRRNSFNKEIVHMRSDITQEYSNDYHEVLNMTLRDIEQKDRETAKALYMLALLNIKLENEFLKKVFGNEIEEKIIALSRYGVVQMNSYEHSKVLNMHDIIREEAIKRLNEKDASYKKVVIDTLVKHFKDFYSKKDIQYFSSLDASNNYVTSLYVFVDIALQNSIIDEDVINALIIALRLNNVLLNKRADPVLYQRLTNQIYGKNLNNISSIKKAFLYSNLVLANSVIYESDENLSKFTKEMLRLLSSIESQKNHEELFFIHTHLILFYLILGDFKEAEKYAKKAEMNINYADNISGLLYWFNNTWLYYELRDIDNGIKALDNYAILSNNKLVSLVGRLFAKDFKIKFMILMGQKNSAKKELKKAIKDAEEYYSNTPSGVVGELEYTKALLYFQEEQYDFADKQCHRALNLFGKVFGGDVVVDLSQAHLHIMLGKAYEVHGNNTLSLEEYKRALRFYDEKSYGKVNMFYEYGELLSNLCVFYYKQKCFVESKFYFQKLVSNFGLDHGIVEKLIKKLPRKYMYQIGGGGRNYL
jgi:hypothetical protein